MSDDIFAIVEKYSHYAPVDIEGIIRAAGILYAEEPLGLEESGRIDRWGGGYRIIVNSEHSRRRRRFTAAHELGHYVYHRDLIGDGISDVAYRSTNAGRYHNKNITTRHETEANRFASAVLMPRSLIERLEHEQNMPLPARLSDMAHALDVSKEALRIRLGYVESKDGRP